VLPFLWCLLSSYSMYAQSGGGIPMSDTAMVLDANIAEHLLRQISEPRLPAPVINHR